MKIDSYHLNSRFAKLIDGHWKSEARKDAGWAKDNVHRQKSATYEAKWNEFGELESVENLAKARPISVMHTKNEFAEALDAVQSDEKLTYLDAVELIYEPRASGGEFSRKTIRVHIKDETVRTFRHSENQLIGTFKLSEFFPKPRPSFVDAMFFYGGHLNLLSGVQIYSYLYHWRSGRFTKFKNLNFKFRLPPHVEAAFCFDDRVYFTKENRFYVFNLTGLLDRKKLQTLAEQNRSIEKQNREGFLEGALPRKMQIEPNEFRATEIVATRIGAIETRATSGPFRIVGEFLTNCSTKSGENLNSRTNFYDDLIAEEQLVQSFGRKSVRPENGRNAHNSNDQIKILYVVLTALFIIVLIVLLVSVFLYLEFYSDRSRNLFAGSIKQQGRIGIVLKANSKSSASSKELDKMLEKTRMRCTTVDNVQVVNAKDALKVNWCDGFKNDFKQNKSSPTGDLKTEFTRKLSLKPKGDLKSDHRDSLKSSPKGCLKNNFNGSLKDSLKNSLKDSFMDSFKAKKRPLEF